MMFVNPTGNCCIYSIFLVGIYKFKFHLEDEE
jgi:hypothetical protein